LEALDVCKPASIPDLGALFKFIEEQIERATQTDNKLRKKGKTWLFKHLCSFDKPLTYFERCISVNSNKAGSCSTVLQTAGPLCHYWLPSVHHQAAVRHDVTGCNHPRSTALRRQHPVGVPACEPGQMAVERRRVQGVGQGGLHLVRPSRQPPRHMFLSIIVHDTSYITHIKSHITHNKPQSVKCLLNGCVVADATVAVRSGRAAQVFHVMAL
jgi:hypothetical protein